MKKSNKKKKKKLNRKKASNNTKKLEKFYLSYEQRLVLYFIFFFLFLLLGLFLISNSVVSSDVEDTVYSENGNIDYKVHLKENDFYDSEYLDENMSYVASLINDIKINFNYSFVTNKKIDFNVNYEVLAKLVISDSVDNTSFYEKEYVIAENVKKNVVDVDHYTISKDIVIDYDYYNEIANKFKSQYNVSTNSYLLVYLKIKKTSKKIDIKESTNKLVLNIPLSQRAVNIKMDSGKIDNHEVIDSDKSNIYFEKKSYLIFGFVFILSSIFLILRLFLFVCKIMKKKNPYDKKLSKILKEYDRFISIVRKIPNLDEYNKTEINSFYELLDVRDSLNKVILFYEIVKHQKALFYIVDGNELYVYILKAIDVETSDPDK